MDQKRIIKLATNITERSFLFSETELVAPARPGKGRNGQVPEEQDSNQWFGEPPLFSWGVTLQSTGVLYFNRYCTLITAHSIHTIYATENQIYYLGVNKQEIVTSLFINKQCSKNTCR